MPEVCKCRCLWHIVKVSNNACKSLCFAGNYLLRQGHVQFRVYAHLYREDETFSFQLNQRARSSHESFAGHTQKLFLPQGSSGMKSLTTGGLFSFFPGQEILSSPPLPRGTWLSENTSLRRCGVRYLLHGGSDE